MYGYNLFESDRWRNNEEISWDVAEYYVYLPGAFIHQDLSFQFVKKLPRAESKNFPVFIGPKGAYITRMTLGMSIMYFPFFIIAHVISLLFNFPANGYSLPYQLAIQLSGMLWTIVGLIFLNKFLRNIFSEKATALCILALGLGTNLYYYSTIESGMAHSFLFGLFSMFLYQNHQFHKTLKVRNLYFALIFLALAILIRPVSILLSIIFLFYPPLGFQNVKKKLSFFWKKPLVAAYSLMICILIALPQMIYWKIYTGQWIYYSYGAERFFFNHPHIIEGLFSYRKGLFVYTPMMLLAIPGFYFLHKISRQMAYLSAIYFLTATYVIFSWWCWWYGGSFGMRAMIESYTILSLPLAALCNYFIKRIWSGISLTVIVLLFCALNIFQTYQYQNTIIHWDSMSKELYWKGFLRTTYPAGYEKMLDQPDYAGAVEGKK